eukprot:5281679-Alexandrium_andersonii.AAC.1
MTTAYLRQLGPEGAVLMRRILIGGVWSATNMCHAGFESEDKRAWSGKERGARKHAWWMCEKFDAIRQE